MFPWGNKADEISESETKHDARKPKQQIKDSYNAAAFKCIHLRPLTEYYTLQMTILLHVLFSSANEESKSCDHFDKCKSLGSVFNYSKNYIKT